MKKKKDELDKIFVNCNKLELGKAKRILGTQDDLSMKDWDWDFPLDLKRISETDKNRFEIFLGMHRWNISDGKLGEKFICIAQRGELIYLSPKIIKVLYNSIKDVKRRKHDG